MTQETACAIPTNISGTRARKGAKPFEAAESQPDDMDFASRKIKYLVEAISERIEDLQHSGLGSGPYDDFTSPSVFLGKGNDENLPLRQVGTTAPMVIGGAWYPTETTVRPSDAEN
jgi:hypothetical protein